MSTLHGLLVQSRTRAAARCWSRHGQVAQRHLSSWSFTIHWHQRPVAAAGHRVTGYLLLCGPLPKAGLPGHWPSSEQSRKTSLFSICPAPDNLSSGTSRQEQIQSSMHFHSHLHAPQKAWLVLKSMDYASEWAIASPAHFPSGHGLGPDTAHRESRQARQGSSLTVAINLAPNVGVHVHECSRIDAKWLSSLVVLLVTQAPSVPADIICFFHKTKVIYSRHACSILLLHSITGIKAFHPDFCWQLPASFTQQFPLDQGDNTVIVMAADRSIADPPCLLAR